MTFSRLLHDLERRHKTNITARFVLPKKSAVLRDFPPGIARELTEVLQKRNITALYSHQHDAYKKICSGENVVIVTPTASGKTLCYNLPVLNELLQHKEARALYLFPTKALAQDQMAELHEMIEQLGADIKTYTYDGDTPVSARKSIRDAGHIVVTNPDMLHSGILPHHTKWIRLFENLKFVVIDEIHTYRGVFGSHVANVIRRLKRICRFYGSDPQFIACSATIANPGELCRQIVGEKITVIDNNGAPGGEKHILLYNPPVVNAQLGIRRSVLLEATKVAANLLRHNLKTIVFARSRTSVEVLLTYLREALAGKIPGQSAIVGYRGGYLPKERRRIERGLRAGALKGVVSTNALELGVDIGSLDACVIVGYPGTIASFWQQAGRVGRRQKPSVVVLIASSLPIDQYMVNNPDYFQTASPEHGLLNPDNLYILVSHLKCAAFELPFKQGEEYGDRPVDDILQYLEEQGMLHFAQGKWHWTADAFPANEVSLRSVTSENVVIIDITYQPRVIGEIDRVSAMTMVHDDAIYLHGAQQYHVEKYDFKELKAYVKRVDVDYYTNANLAVELRVLDEFSAQPNKLFSTHFGEVLTRAKATVFKKIKFGTHENVGWGKIDLPEEQMHTAACWFSFNDLTELSPEELQSGLMAFANVVANVAPLFLMCDPHDIRVIPQVKAPYGGVPSVYVYDNYPGGIGLAEKLYQIYGSVLAAAFRLLQQCPCKNGCPSCAGPQSEVGLMGKSIALQIFERIFSD